MRLRALRIAILLATVAALGACALAPSALAALPDVTVTAVPGASSATATYAVPNNETCSPASGSLFPLGDTVVSCSAVADSFEVHVLAADTTPPTIISGSDLTVDAVTLAGAVVNYDLPTVSDDRAGVGAPVCAPASGSVFPIGLTPIICSVSDASGNTTSKLFRSVTVNALEEPLGVNDVNPFHAALGTIATPVRATLLRFGFRAPVTCSASCHVSIALQAVLRTKHGRKFATSYARIGGGSASFTYAPRNEVISVRLTSAEAKALRSHRAKISARLVVAISHPGAHTTTILRALKL